MIAAGKPRGWEESLGTGSALQRCPEWPTSSIQALPLRDLMTRSPFKAPLGSNQAPSTFAFRETFRSQSMTILKSQLNSKVASNFDLVATAMGKGRKESVESGSISNTARTKGVRAREPRRRVSWMKISSVCQEFWVNPLTRILQGKPGSWDF